MFNRNNYLVVWPYLLMAAALMAGVAAAAHAQSAIVNTHKPFTLKIRYGKNANPAATASDAPKARRIETRVAELDSGRIETRDAVLEYWIDATGESGDIALSIDFTHAVAQDRVHTSTRLLMSAGEWKMMSFSDDSQTGTESVFVRVDRN